MIRLKDKLADLHRLAGLPKLTWQYNCMPWLLALKVRYQRWKEKQRQFWRYGK